MVLKEPSILVLHGPNLNLLGQRNQEVYGSLTLDELNQKLLSHGKNQKAKLEFKQSNLEGELVSIIQDAPTLFEAVVLNPGGFSHTSVAIRDAIESCSIPVIECHISNIHAREEFRKHSLTAAMCHGIVVGFGALSYHLALDAALHIVKNPSGI